MIPRLHVVTDDDVISRPDTTEWSIRLIESLGSDIAIHLRGPGTSGRRLYGAARRIHDAVGGGSLFVNDRVDVALCFSAVGLQLRATSFSAQVARRLSGSDRRIGLSIRADGPPPDDRAVSFVVAGSAFATPSHPDGSVAGVEAIRRMAAVSAVPVVAIGGISAERIGVLVRAGAHGVAVLRAVWSDPDPVRAAVQLLATWKGEIERHEHDDHESRQR